MKTAEERAREIASDFLLKEICDEFWIQGHAINYLSKAILDFSDERCAELKAEMKMWADDSQSNYARCHGYAGKIAQLEAENERLTNRLRAVVKIAKGQRKALRNQNIGSLRHDRQLTRWMNVALSERAKSRILKAENEKMREALKLAKELRIYCLGSDCSTLNMIERFDAAMSDLNPVLAWEEKK